AIISPIPLVPPVTRAILPLTEKSSLIPTYPHRHAQDTHACLTVGKLCQFAPNNILFPQASRSFTRRHRPLAVSKESNLTQLAHDRLRADLLACRLKPGERLIINQLCQYLDVSLGAVREALSRLSSEGLVIAEPQRGFRVAPISAEDLKDLTAARL